MQTSWQILFVVFCRDVTSAETSRKCTPERYAAVSVTRGQVVTCCVEYSKPARAGLKYFINLKHVSYVNYSEISEGYSHLYAKFLIAH